MERDEDMKSRVWNGAELEVAECLSLCGSARHGVLKKVSHFGSHALADGWETFRRPQPSARPWDPP